MSGIKNGDYLVCSKTVIKPLYNINTRYYSDENFTFIKGNKYKIYTTFLSYYIIQVLLFCDNEDITYTAKFQIYEGMYFPLSEYLWEHFYTDAEFRSERLKKLLA